MMTYTSIYQNSYVVAIIVFIILVALFYIFEIGFTTEIKDGKIIKHFSFKYPLAISLIVWLFWYFYMYPPIDNDVGLTTVKQYRQASTSDIFNPYDQEINMVNKY